MIGAAEQPSHARAAELVERLRVDGVRIARVMYADLYGRLRSKQLPLDELPRAVDGIAYCEASLVENLHGEPLSGGGFPADAGFPDLRAEPDLESARIVPWEPDVVCLLSYLHDADGPSGLCVRGALARVAARLAAAGLEAATAAEPEFYLLRGDAPGAEPYSPGTGMAYTTGVRADPGGVLGRMHRHLIALGIGVTVANREFSPGQFEVNLRHASALDAADAAVLLKDAVKELAAREELAASFMPKPLQGAEGSSLHLHVSLWRDGANAFAGDGADGLSDLCHGFLAGVLTHAPALTAFASSTVNSYKRLVPGGLAPVAAGWGRDDRLAYVRVPAERGSASRLEVRGGDAAANPYLLGAAVLLAGLDGIERALTPPPQALPLPRSLEQALALLDGSDLLRGGLGDRLVDSFLGLKRDECERARLAVTDWDWREYARHA